MVDRKAELHGEAQEDCRGVQPRRWVRGDAFHFCFWEAHTTWLLMPAYGICSHDLGLPFDDVWCVPPLGVLF